MISCKNQSSTELETSKFKQIIFGRYCGECNGICAPMFRLIINQKEPTLYADFNDTYFNLEHRTEFNSDLNQEQKLEIANEIAEKIPDTLYNWETDSLDALLC